MQPLMSNRPFNLRLISLTLYFNSKSIIGYDIARFFYMRLMTAYRQQHNTNFLASTPISVRNSAYSDMATNFLHYKRRL